MDNIKIALVGNPNSGKTTLFNALTGSNQHVSNWPGVTVEKKEGKFKYKDKLITLVDLPGIYSLSPYSIEEIVARKFIIEEKPDVVINIIDATNIERNLYLTIQLLEMEKPVIVALNMMDEVEAHGDVIYLDKLQEELGIPTIPVTARQGKNVLKLLDAAVIQAQKGFVLEPDDLYDDFTHSIHHKIDLLIFENAKAKHLPIHWVSIKMLEGDPLLKKHLNVSDEINDKIEVIIKEYEASSKYGDRETLVADSRYKFIEKVVKKSIVKGETKGILTMSEKIDKVVTNRFLALPLFIFIMFAIFTLTFGSIGAWLKDGITSLIGNDFTPFLANWLKEIQTADWIRSLVIDGVIAGVGGILTFLPQIAILFFCLSHLEDSGYMARVAFIMDRMLRRFGLSGKAFIPMLMGFGCTVPATMAARTMDNVKTKRMTILLVPFMSCSAKLPIYGLFTSVFFKDNQVLIVLSLYLLGIIMGIISGIIFKKTLFKGDDASFLMELPPYRLPNFKGTIIHVWHNVEHFMKRAATLIFSMSVLLWFLKNFNFSLKMVNSGENSILGILGNTIAPIFTPLGFGTWQAVVALLTGLIAKEAVVSSLSLFYGLNAVGGVALSGAFSSPVAAYAFLVFVLLYVPCVAAFSTMKRELGSWKWAIFSAGWQIGIAYIISMFIYQVVKLL